MLQSLFVKRLLMLIIEACLCFFFFLGAIQFNVHAAMLLVVFSFKLSMHMLLNIYKMKYITMLNTFHPNLCLSPKHSYLSNNCECGFPLEYRSKKPPINTQNSQSNLPNINTTTHHPRKIQKKKQK